MHYVRDGIELDIRRLVGSTVLSFCLVDLIETADGVLRAFAEAPYPFDDASLCDLERKIDGFARNMTGRGLDTWDFRVVPIAPGGRQRIVPGCS